MWDVTECFIHLLSRVLYFVLTYVVCCFEEHHFCSVSHNGSSSWFLKKQLSNSEQVFTSLYLWPVWCLHLQFCLSLVCVSRLMLMFDVICWNTCAWSVLFVFSGSLCWCMSPCIRCVCACVSVSIGVLEGKSPWPHEACNSPRKLQQLLFHNSAGTLYTLRRRVSMLNPLSLMRAFMCYGCKVEINL